MADRWRERKSSYLRISCQRETVVTTNDKKSAKVVVARTKREGPNPTSVKTGETTT